MEKKIKRTETVWIINGFFVQPKEKKNVFMANRSNEPRDLEIFIEKKNYFVLSLPFSLFFKGVFLTKSSNDAAKTDNFKNK